MDNQFRFALSIREINLKILVINIKYLGDLVVSSPAIRSLRKAYPKAEIIMLLRKGFELVFSHNPNVDRIISFDPQLKGNSSFKKIIDGLKFIKKLRSEKFDTVIVLHPGDRTAFWAWFTAAKIRIAPLKQSFSFLFNKKVPVEENSISYIEYYNKIISEYNVTIDSDNTEIYFSKSDEKWASDFVNINSIGKEHVLIGIHPGASEPSKIWKVENFVQLIERLLIRPEIRIIVFEGPQEKEICGELKNKFRDQSIIYFVNTDILKVAALISRCRLFISHDTGTRHIAVAVNTTVLALIPEDFEKCWNFYSENNNHFTIFGKRNLLQSDLNVKPFLDSISVEDVYKKTGELLQLW